MSEDSGGWQNTHKRGRDGHASADTPRRHGPHQHEVPRMEGKGRGGTQVSASKEILPQGDQRRRGAEQAHHRRGRHHSQRHCF